MLSRFKSRRALAPWQPLLEAYGVLPGYRDMHGQLRQPSEAAASAMLRALGAPVWSAGDVAAALRAARRRWWQQAGEPVVVRWQGEAVRPLDLRIRRAEAGAAAACELQLEEGAAQRWEVRLRAPAFGVRAAVDGQQYVVCRVALPAALPTGYHRLRIAWRDRSYEALLIVAPAQAHVEGPKRWGVFAPLYALREAQDWGIGDWTHLQQLSVWVAQHAGQVVATLPMLAAFLGPRPFEPSPYAPASRLAWNEIFLDVTQLPEYAGSAAARQQVAAAPFQQALQALRQAPHVDYGHVMALKRQVLEPLSCALSAARQAALEAFVAQHPVVEDYARYRAAVERYGIPWSRWPQPLREGTIAPGDVDTTALQYHRYVQWACHEQLGEVSRRVRAAGISLYLDLPLGVHREGYDVWRDREAFLLGCSGGAPPDLMFTTGQDWGFPPLHPEGLRRQQYRYFRACVRHHLRYAGLLRLDHVMSLYRLFVIPHGMPSQEGLYVRYHTEELAAILCLESQRHQAVIIGEDLGLVPAEVTAAMRRHRFHRLYITQFELAARPQALHPPGADTVASLNTHDLHPFAASWNGRDLEDRVAAGQLPIEALPAERARREQLKAAFVAFLRQQGLLEAPEPDTAAVLRACLRWLAQSPAALVLVNLEDLWLEEAPQNMPGTWREQPNWQRKARFSLEDLARHPEIAALLRPVAAARGAGGRP